MSEIMTTFGSRLCVYCCGVFSAIESCRREDSRSISPADTTRIALHPSLPSLIEAVQSGCQLCNFIAVRLRKEFGDGGINRTGRKPDWDRLPDDAEIDWNKLYFDLSVSNRVDPVYLDPSVGNQASSIKSFDYRLAFYAGSSVVFDIVGYDETLIENDKIKEAHYSMNYVPSATTGGLETLELARAWISNCRRNHVICRKVCSENWWPTRLLHIGPLCTELDLLNVRIQLKQKEIPHGPYMTLSHCWGNAADIVKLTEDNYQSMLDTGVPFKTLPQTFRDAICLARFLGIEYLWIDSLCIIQNSLGNKDWKREGQTMANVYRHSVCNIAATASRGPTGGCFYPRNPQVVTPLRVSLPRRKAGERSSASFAASSQKIERGESSSSSPETYIFCPSDVWRTDVEDAPLNRRAWVVQERLLAPRQIHCGRQQLLWECHQMTASEMFPLKTPFPDWSYGSKPVSTELKRLNVILAQLRELRQAMETSKLSPRGLGSTHNLYSNLAAGLMHKSRVLYKDATSKTTSKFQIVEACRLPVSERQGELNEDASISTRVRGLRDEVYDCWKIIVEQYSACTLTYRTDKLMAISSIASHIQDALRDIDVYVVGLWLTELPYQLLWETNRIAGLGEASYNIAPSWSWASLETGVTGPKTATRWSGYHDMPFIDILEVCNGYSIIGHVDAGDDAITYLKLRCLLYKVHAPKGKDSYIWTRPFEGGVNVYHILSKASKIMVSDDWCRMDTAEGYSQWEVAYLMPVIKGFKSKHAVQGLIVVRCQDKPGFFRRIGTWDQWTIQEGDMENSSDDEPACKYEFLKHLESTTSRDRCTVVLI